MIFIIPDKSTEGSPDRFDDRRWCTYVSTYCSVVSTNRLESASECLLRDELETLYPFFLYLLRTNVNKAVHVSETIRPSGAELWRANDNMVFRVVVVWPPSHVNVYSSVEAEDETGMLAVEN